ncbi:MAG TPA: tetratricopeptide repeat protein [Solirubrobacteraceae bacterium]|jgi:Flp pilus assembly protein TadD
MASIADSARERSRARLDEGDFTESLQAAREGLSAVPDDVELLVLAGRAGVELDSDDAVEHLRRATELAADDATAWHHLGEALAAEGLTKEADAAFRRAVELDPDDQIALTHLGHTSLAAGRQDEAVDYLSRAADNIQGASTAAISLVEMYRSFGRYEDAAAQAKRLAAAVPDDALAWLDVAELTFEVGQFDEARAAFERLREVDDVPGHEAYPIHGMLRVAVRGDEWERAQQLADQAAAIDPQGLGTDVGAFLRARTGGDGEDEPERVPTAEELDSALAASLAEYRRTLADDRRLSTGDSIG